ncbi:hypothetical protein AAG570_012922 [Ranatra chinensis]|uniref:Uncharacterized protein n=1 Tax=Ranatra chinensis TaxID=642074 RepID=A0ABD0YF98_9HEMI
MSTPAMAADQHYYKDKVPKRRSIGVGTSVLTRDVGVWQGCRTSSVSTDTDDLAEQTRSDHSFLSLKTLIQSPNTSNRTDMAVNTHLRMDAIYLESDIERDLEKIVDRFRERILAMTTKAKSVVSVQIQVCHETVNASTMARPSTVSAYCQTTAPITRDVGVSEDTTTPETCSKCSVQKRSLGVSTGTSSFSLQALVPAKSVKSVGCGREKASSTSKSTDTDGLRPRREVGVNTMKRKLVDAGVDASPRTDPLPSRIPRPETFQLTRIYKEGRRSYNAEPKDLGQVQHFRIYRLRSHTRLKRPDIQ